MARWFLLEFSDESFGCLGDVVGALNDVGNFEGRIFVAWHGFLVTFGLKAVC